MWGRPVLVGGRDRWPLWSPDMTVRSNGNASISADTSICAIADVDMLITLQKDTDFGQHFLDTFSYFFGTFSLSFFDSFLTLFAIIFFFGISLS